MNPHSLFPVQRGSRRALLDRAGEATRPYMACEATARVTPDALVRGRRAVLLNLPKNPRIGRRGSPNHYRVASGRGHHGASVLRSANISVSNYRNLHRVFDRGNPLPSRGSAVTLLARARVQRDRAQSAVLSDFRQLDANNLIVIPTGTELHRKRNLYRGAYGFENPSNARQV